MTDPLSLLPPYGVYVWWKVQEHPGYARIAGRVVRRAERRIFDRAPFRSVAWQIDARARPNGIRGAFPTRATYPQVIA